MEELLSKIADFFNYTTWWLNEYIFSGLVDFLKALITLIIKILEFCVDILRWIMSFM